MRCWLDHLVLQEKQEGLDKQDPLASLDLLGPLVPLDLKVHGEGPDLLDVLEGRGLLGHEDLLGPQGLLEKLGKLELLAQLDHKVSKATV